ncbi:MAG: N-acetyltransferase [Gammaproteobacteria bacterium]|nr:MAG: N-acetyltransferase [Gammaproteobacteria bacterium]
MIIKPAEKKDIPEIFYLYKNVAAVPGYLARLENEITPDYIETNILAALDNGACLIALDTQPNDNIQTNNTVGVIHGHSTGIKCFEHVIGNITIAVMPNLQNQGIGKLLFNEFIAHVKINMPHITRIELMARESNSKSINLYKSLGFEIEGKLRTRIQNTDGSKEDDLVMGLLL